MICFSGNPDSWLQTIKFKGAKDLFYQLKYSSWFLAAIDKQSLYWLNTKLIVLGKPN